MKHYLRVVSKFAYIPTLVVALGFFFGGIFGVTQGLNARDDVKSGVVREHITVSKDAPNEALQNKPVTDAATAEAQADAIWEHTMKATGGKTYAELKRDDPARTTAKDSALLRGLLMLSVMGFGVAELVVGVSVGFIVLGLLLLFVAVPLAYHVPRLLDV